MEALFLLLSWRSSVGAPSISFTKTDRGRDAVVTHKETESRLEEAAIDNARKFLADAVVVGIKSSKISASRLREFFSKNAKRFQRDEAIFGLRLAGSFFCSKA
jgi:hypothetical protein